MSKKLQAIRLREIDGFTYWPSGMDIAKLMVAVIVNRGHCGLIERKQSDGSWRVTHEFSPVNGLRSKNQTGLEF